MPKPSPGKMENITLSGGSLAGMVVISSNVFGLR
jgi:hypothetical protein